MQRLLLPFSWLYALVLRFRHALYDKGILASHRPTVPTIVVGNLSFGGTGKTPHVELALRCLGGIEPIATLSRGYGRNGMGTLRVEASDPASAVGDEPLQLKRKFPAVEVFVGADRVKALADMQERIPGLRAVVLDDAFQHRRLKAGLNIVLTTWAKPWYKDHLVPAGSLRDIPVRGRQAQLVVVSKCPALPDAQEQDRWRARLGLGREQQLFFSGLQYSPARVLQPNGTLGADVDLHNAACLLLTGIADATPLVEHLRLQCKTFEHLPFPDHHAFSAADLRKAADRLATFAAGPNVLVTTEKDAMRLLPHLHQGPLANLAIAVIAVEAVILNEPERFKRSLIAHVGTHTAHS